MIRGRAHALKQQWFYLTGFGLAVAGAFAALAYLFIGGREQILALVAGIGLLGLAQIILLGMIFNLHDRLAHRLRRFANEQAAAHNKTNESFEVIFNQLAQFEGDEHSRAQLVADGLADVKSTFNAFRDKLALDVANREATAVAAEVAPLPEAIAAVAVPVAETATEKASVISNHISYALEPVVDLPTKRTAHYRLHASMDIAGEALSGDLFYQAAAAAGIRPLIDKFSVEEALGLLQRLRGRDPHLAILVPMGGETLQDVATLSEILGACAASPVAGGLIVELPHVVLAGLGEQGLEGLALMARQGVVFALSQASVAGLDLEAMKLLNVKLVGLNVGHLAGEAPSESLLGFAQMARLARVNIYVTDVASASVVPHLAQFTRLACGPCFAAPRRVRRVAEVAQAQTQTAIAA